MRIIFGRGRPQFEQLSFLHPKEGTGMWDDPTNGPVRSGHIARMMGVGSLADLPDKHSALVAQSLNQSNVPLQHIADVANAGITLGSNRDQYSHGYYQPLTPPSSFDLDKPGHIAINTARPTTVVHEFGHALHDVNVRQFSPRGWGDSDQSFTPVNIPFLKQTTDVSPVAEGVAVGYSTRFSGGTDRSYRRMMRRAGPEHLEKFSQARDGVIQSGQVPFSYRDQPLGSPAPPDDGEQLTLDLGH